MDNLERAHRAQAAIEHYQGNDVADESHARDLICDVLHGMAIEGKDITQEIYTAISNFLEEATEEKKLNPEWSEVHLAIGRLIRDRQR